MRAKIRKRAIKMIKIITLIPASIAYLMIAACNSGDSSKGGENPGIDTSISGAPSGAETDPLKELEGEGKLPPIGTGPKTTPSTGAAVDGLSVYPPSVDPDQDNVPNSAIAGHPEIAVDNCPNVFNPGQEDDDGDGVGNLCE